MAVGDGGGDAHEGENEAWPGLSVSDLADLTMAPRAGDNQSSAGVDWRDVAGKIWNAPNTALGLVYGGLGMAAGEVGHLFDRGIPQPKAFWDGNGVQFTNNPFGGVGAVTLGNTTTWYGDPYDPTDTVWHEDGVPILENGHTYPQHENEHTYQGQQLGPLYLPSNALGGLNALFHGQDWHGSQNWNEVGPKSDPPSSWPFGQKG